MNHIPFSNQRGFTLIEALTAFTILVMVLGSFITLVLLSMRSFEVSKRRYTAAKIAQEGMELTISKRDNHVLCVESGSCSLSDWKNNIIGSWEVDATQINQVLATGQFGSFDSSRKLCIKETPPKDAGKFGYCGNPADALPGEYTREVRITAISDEKVLAQSIVNWKSRFFSDSLVLEEVLFGLP